MISVILPTLWVPGHEYILNNLQGLSNIDTVGEIIIIDNAPEKAPDVSHLPKVKVLPQQENIYVNPAWNLGVSYATNSKLLILNDDISTDWRLIDEALEYITPGFGMIGIGPNCWNYSGNEVVRFETLTRRGFGYGCAFFIHRDSYNVIPSELKIWSGDDYLFSKNTLRGRFNLAIMNWRVEPFENKLSVTSDLKEFDTIKHADRKLFKS